MNLNQLHYFAVLARLQHYTKASEELGITQPSLSHAVNALEKEVGTRFFEKQGRNVVLTKYGKFFLQYVEESLQVLDVGVQKTREMTGQAEGLVELAYIYTQGSEFVPQLAGDFMRAYEELKIKFRFTVGNTYEVIQGLKEEKYDIVFCSMLEGEPSIEFIPVGTEKLVLVVPKGHTLSDKKIVDLEQAAAYPQIYFTKNSGLRPVVDKLFGNAHLTPKIAYEIEEDGSMAGLVAQNFGIAVMPDIPVLKQLNVDVLDIRSPEQRRYIYMARIKDRYQTPMVKRFTEFVKRRRL